MPTERMTALDAGFLRLETRVSPLHIGSLAIFEGPAPAYDDLAAIVTSKLPSLPRHRQRVRFVPLELGRPVWVDDPHFFLGYHLRSTALPAPGGDPQLRRLVGRIMSQHLDRHKPLWEAWIVEGLEDGRWALVCKAHHCMVDGIGGIDLLGAMLDASPDATPGPSRRWIASREPSTAALVTDALRERLLSPLEQTRAFTSFAAQPRRATELAVTTARGLASMTGVLRPTPLNSLLGPIGPHRRYRWGRLTLQDVRDVRRGTGATINDVVMASVAGGYRRLLRARGERPGPRHLRALVPVSVRRPTDPVAVNRVSCVVTELPVEIADPIERLAEMQRRLRARKRSAEPIAGEVVTSLASYAPAPLLAVALRIAFSLPQRNITTVTTNVPGPRRPLYLAGRRMLEIFPYVPIADGLRTGVAVLTYQDRLGLGVTADYDTVPDVDVLIHGIEDSLAELVKAARSD